MRQPAEDTTPFRWHRVTPDQLLDHLVACIGKVLARSGNGDLYFVDRSLDSMDDLLSGAIADLSLACPLNDLLW